MQVISLDQIKAVLPTIDLIPTIEAGFAAYAANNAVVPPVGEFLMDKGEAHIKYGFIQDDDLVELGQLVWGNVNGRTAPEQITIADLTGIAVQDIQIAKAVYLALQND